MQYNGVYQDEYKLCYCESLLGVAAWGVCLCCLCSIGEGGVNTLVKCLLTNSSFHGMDISLELVVAQYTHQYVFISFQLIV